LYHYNQAGLRRLYLRSVTVQEVAMTGKRTVCRWIVFGMLMTLSFAGVVQGQDLSPAQKQEFIDAREALEAARIAQAEKYSAGEMKKAVAFLDQAEKVRASKDGVQFTQASRLARVHAELAQAAAELKREEETLAATNDALGKIKAELERLKKDR
jgi:succinate dehydrogenase/fumarate reductase flavoprotein subunit